MRRVIAALILISFLVISCNAAAYATTTLTKQEIINLANEIKRLKNEVQYWKQKAQIYKNAYEQLHKKSLETQTYIFKFEKNVNEQLQNYVKQLQQQNELLRLYRKKSDTLEAQLEAQKALTFTLCIAAFLLGGKILR